MRDEKGKLKGFAFVGYTNVFDAAKAVKECNAATVNGMYLSFYSLT